MKKIISTVFLVLFLIAVMTPAYLRYVGDVEYGLETERRLIQLDKIRENGLDNVKAERDSLKLKADAFLEDGISLAGEWQEMWVDDMDIPENPRDFMDIQDSCISTADSSMVTVTGVVPGIPRSDDGRLYLFALDLYDNAIGEDDVPLDEAVIDRTYPFYRMQTPLNFKRAGSLLYKKMVVAAKIDNKYVALTDPKCITNPELKASTAQYKVPASKKGFILHSGRLHSGELEDLNIKQCAYNIWLGRLQDTRNGAVYYEYNGKSYAFSKSDIEAFDVIFGTLTAKGIQCTAVLLNDAHANAHMIHPDARGGSAPYYMFNGATREGVEHLAAAASFLAERYSGSHGLISNWIIANEINARKEWNYYPYTDVDTYTRQYYNGFRVFYNAIKSINSEAKIYMPLDQTWNRNIDASTKDYDARDVLDSFNRIVKSEGNMDWNLAYHPYPVPLTTAIFWGDTMGNRRYVKNSVDTPMVSMLNINVVTNYLNQEHFYNTKGECRQVLLSEQGFTSTSGEANQAAAVAYAYKIAEANSHINGFILNRQIDEAAEIAQGLALGIIRQDGSRKAAYDVYKYIDTPEGDAHMEGVKQTLGISSWSEIIRSY